MNFDELYGHAVAELRKVILSGNKHFKESRSEMQQYVVDGGSCN